MRAVEFGTDRTARVVDVAPPRPDAGEVTVRITSAGVCGSDVTALRGVHPFRVPPLITGHEGGGIVTAVGDGVDPSWRGRPVALEPQRACGRCAPCTTGLVHLCRDRLMLGMAGWPGTLAEQVTAPVSCLHPVDDAVPAALLALAEPLAVAEHAVAAGPAPRGARVAVLGGGPIGALLVHLAATGGAEHLLATDPRAASREACTRVGAHATADPTTDGWRDAVRGDGFDLVHVAATAPGILDDAVALLRPRGTVVVVGLFAGPVTFDVAALQQDEKSLVGSTVYTADDFAAAARGLGEHWRTLAGLVTDGGGLDGAVAFLRAALDGRSDDVVKLLVDPADGAR
ncbi:zinc-dependent alcohol dehydrogenase [Pseudonocardia spirodelae]|uniref:Alcohol dehydrogenase catalytic domain-containing protein n=1 Tax=Pseudonocardia spirodelae TaxID=3133431 RepID=A0ABU8T0C4_9PSEU